MNTKISETRQSFETSVCNYYESKPDGLNQTVLVQSLKAKYPGLEDLVYLKNDFELTKDNKSTRILGSLKMIQTDEGFIVYKEHFDGIQLQKYLSNWKFNVPQFLNLAIKLSKLLQELHQKKLIVKEFVIDHILISPDTHELKICCLGSASQLVRERPEYSSEFNYYGSLWHIAPEQTGRMGRSLDYRADFYSLGILLYQILCQRKPFNYSDSLELIHAHIAKSPIEPKNIFKDIPDPINEIVLKLMSKNAEDRYQSEDGIIEDLNHCLREWQNKGTLQAFKLGKKDYSSVFCMSEKLYGRDDELEILIRCWKRIHQNKVEFLMVSGYSGIGKTRLISEIKKPVFESNGYFVSGKFDQLNRETPYSAFIQAFRIIVQILIGEKEANINQWKTAINKQTNDNIAILCALIPDLKLLVDNPGEVVNLGPIEGKKRFNAAFIDFLSIFEVENKPLILFIDDLQWADSDSLELLTTIYSSQLKNILIIGAYRDNEVDESHPLIMSIYQMKAQDAEHFKEIVLKELASDDINRLLADSLHMSGNNTRELTEVAMSKTHGNPFFVKQFIEKQVEEGRIYFDIDSISWLWDIENVRNLEVSEYVVDLLLKKMGKLTKDAQEIISLAAYIGNTFDMETLSAISDKSTKSINLLIWEIMNEDFISSLGQWAMYTSEDLWDELNLVNKPIYRFKFQHDRIQQAAYSIIDTSEREATHYKIGKRLLSKFSDQELSDNLFEVLNHLNLGRKLINYPKDKMELAQLNLTGAKKAFNNNVIRPALNHYRIGMEMIEGNQSSSIFKDLLIGQSECEYLLGNYQDSEELFNEAVLKADSNLNKADILCRKMALYENTQRHALAIDAARDGLKLLGMKLPKKANKLNVLSELLTVKYLLRNKTTEQLLNNRVLESKEKILMMKILMNLWGPVYLLQNQELLAFKILRMVNISIRYGNSIESALAFAFYGYVISAQMKDYQKGCEFAKLGMDLNLKLQDKTLRSKVIVIADGCVADWGKPFKELLPSLREAYNVGIESNDIIYAGYATTFMNRKNFWGSEDLEGVFQKIQGYFQFATKINSIVSQHQLMPWARITYDLLDKKLTSDIFGELISEDDHVGFINELNNNYKLQLPLANYYTAKCFYHYVMSEPGIALDYAVKADPFMSSVMGLNEWSQQIIYKTLSVLTQLNNGAIVSGRLRKDLLKNIALVKMWSESAPANYKSQYLLMIAEKKRSEGNFKDALQNYKDSISQAHESGLSYMSGIGYERLSIFFKETKDNDQARNMMQKALVEFHHWGAKRKVNQLKNLHSYLANVGKTETGSNLVSSSSLDLQSVLSASQTLAGEVMTDKLLEKLLLILIKNAGAQNAYLIREKNNLIYIEATSRMANDNVCEIRPYLLEEVPEVLHKVVRKVFKTEEFVLIDDVKNDSEYERDTQLKDLHSKSILCMPIHSKGGLTAVIYLDNQLSSHVFTTQRLELLKLLSGQIAISLENAQLYENLESKVKERTNTIEQQKLELEEEKLKSDILLLNILPSEIAEELKSVGYCRPRRYESVTIMFTDFEKFTQMSEKMSPEEIVEIVDYQYKAFDHIIEKYGLEKIKTMGDAYMCVCGLPESFANHAERAVSAAKEMLEFVHKYTKERRASNLPCCEIRIGLNTGAVVAGVVGHKKFAFDIWGDSVNTASRMQSAGEPGKINISGTTYALIQDNFNCRYRGKIDVKNKGEIDMYFIEN